MTKETINANRNLPAGEVVALFKKTLPALLSGIGADRNWLWWSGPKPDEATRKALSEMGWRFSGKPHTLPDSRVAHWYHAAGGPVVFRRKGSQPASDESAPINNRKAKASGKSGERKPAERIAPTADQPPAQSGAVGNLFNLLKSIQ